MKPGLAISANLRLVRMLGEGGMGSVWVADHLTLGTQVAVKLMSRAVASDPSFIARFRREAGAAAQLKSPHVAQVFDHGVTESGEPYIVMELLEGEDLHERVDRSGPLPLAFVADVIGQAAKALGRAHQLGIVHRDIKPENLFLCDNEGDLLVKVLDFGIAKLPADAALSVTSTGGTLGTPLYMSPEQLLSAKRVDFQADLWSLAVVAYFMLTTRLPFTGDTLGAVSVAVHGGVFKPASELRSGLAAGVDAWFQRALQREPSARFGSAKEMAQALREALALSTSPLPAAAEDARRALLESLPTVDAAGEIDRPSPAVKVATSAPRMASQDAPDTRLGTLGGTTLARGSDTNRRKLALAAALAAGAIAGLLVWKPWQSGAAPPAEVLASPAATAPSSFTVTVAPATAESAGVAPIVTAAPATSPAPDASGVSAAAPTASGSARKSAPGGSKAAPVSTIKDTVGF